MEGGRTAKIGWRESAGRKWKEGWHRWKDGKI